MNHPRSRWLARWLPRWLPRWLARWLSGPRLHALLLGGLGNHEDFAVMSKHEGIGEMIGLDQTRPNDVHLPIAANFSDRNGRLFRVFVEILEK